MLLVNSSPRTSSYRGLVKLNRAGLWNKGPEKSLVNGIRINGGRNNQGRITCRHRGGGHKRLIRTVDFLRMRDDSQATVKRIEYDPNRSAFIALLEYQDGTKSYILCPQGMQPDDVVLSGDKAPIKAGNAMALSRIPDGTIIHNIELSPGKGGQMVRSAGTFGQIVGREREYVIVRLSSGEIRKFLARCRATIGAVSNPDHKNLALAKAGRKRWMGIRPTVRGVAMNPVDHPHGGGEGKTSGGRHPVTPWGKGTKGTKTVRYHRNSQLIVKKRGK